MKGLELNIKICVTIAVILGVFMAILNLYGSWSQHHLTVYDPFLYATLCCIAFAFIMASVAHKDQDLRLTKILWFNYRLEHALRLTAYFFGGVIVFGVNSPLKWIEIAHFIFTGLGIISGYFSLLFWAKTKQQRFWSYAALIV
ncbi:hypothetical protein [uncultured Winogradskyella sp.]|uniref:hypothetical protein n=1 Tax=uncultured Winogradskyella sp. TaxID=395353 RepID=UPI002622338D|nr:hypothetical protein [uncultured Winogradskyella sp.]